MNELVNSVDYWVDALTKDTDPELFGFTDEGLYYTTRNKRNYGRWMWDCGYNAGLVNLQTKVNTYCVPQWISVKDRLPEKSVTVLICAAGHRVTAYYDKVKEVFRLTEDDNLYYLPEYVTHWTYLPEPPESEDNNE